MSEKNKRRLTRVRYLASLAMLPALLLLTLSFLPGPSDAEALYVVSDSDYVHVDALASDVFLTDGSAELLSREPGSDMLLTAGLDVTVHYQGRDFSGVTGNETVDALFSRMGIHPSPLEMAAISNADGAMEISVSSEFTFYEHISRVTEHETIYRDSPHIPAGQEVVTQEGKDGEYTEIYEVIFQDGEETVRQLIDVVDTEPVPTIIERGTMVNSAENGEPVASITTNDDGTGVITLESGGTLTFREARTMTGTAYTKYEGKVGSITASGTPVHVGVVAVNRKDLPLGTKVYVVSNDGKYVYGFAVAEDTGVGRGVIDLYMDTYNDCIQFGRRTCTVYILD